MYTEGLVVIAGFAVVFIPLLIWILTQIVNIKELMGKLSENVGRMDERLKVMEKSTDRWHYEMRDEFIKIYDMVIPKKATSNPISPEEKERLLKKFQLGTISKEEAKELQSILEKEKKDAESAGNIVAVIAIGLLLVALAYLLYKLLEEE